MSNINPSNGPIAQPRDLFVTEEGGVWTVYEQIDRGVYDAVGSFDTPGEAYEFIEELNEEATP